MEKFDLRDTIKPSELKNYPLYKHINANDITTTDLVYIESKEEVEALPPELRVKTLTDFAILHNYLLEDENTAENLPKQNGKIIGCYWTRDMVLDNYQENPSNAGRFKVNEEGKFVQDYYILQGGFAPALKIDIKKYLKLVGNKKLNIKENKIDNAVYRTLEFGEYPQNKVDNNTANLLESAFNNGNLESSLKATGKVFSAPHITPQDVADFSTSIKFYPEFEFNGERYVRFIAGNSLNIYDSEVMLLNSGETVGSVYGLPVWIKVEPLDFVIKNWDNLPADINPKGNGEDSFFDIVTENIPYVTECFAIRDEDKAYLWHNTALRAFLNGKSMHKPDKSVSPHLAMKSNLDFSDGFNFLNEAFNVNRNALTEYILPAFETEIADNQFNGCVGLEKIVFHNNLINIGKNVFDNCKFKYLYLTPEKNFVLSVSKPKEHVYTDLIETSVLQEIFSQTKYPSSYKMGSWTQILACGKNSEEIFKLLKILKSNNSIVLPPTFIKFLSDNNLLEDFNKSAYFKNFKRVLPVFYEKLIFADYVQPDTIINFFKFATCLGCFSSEPLLDNKGNPTKDMVSRKACELLSQILERKTLSHYQIYAYFHSLQVNLKPKQELLTFLSHTDKKKFVNIENLIKIEHELPGVFAKVVGDFSSVKNFKTTLNENGFSYERSWEEAIKNSFNQVKYVGVSEENLDIAKLYTEKGLPQKIFNKAAELRYMAKTRNVPRHILNKEINEKKLIEETQNIVNEIKKSHLECKKLIETKLDKAFTYKMLDKHHPLNGILGLAVSCCSSLDTNTYGKYIAEATIISPDVQNLVVENKKGEIIAKGTIYVNKNLGYAVINDFEVNRKYRTHEIEGSGRYNTEDGNPSEIERQRIFDALIRGVKAFVKEYDIENPNKPINIVTVGWTYNRLKKQTEKFEELKKHLIVPSEYFFVDAQSKQFILYDRKKELNQSKEKEL